MAIKDTGTHKADGAGKRLLLQTVTAVERLRMWLLGQRWFKSVLLPALPRRVRWAARWAYLAPVDLADRLLGRREAGVPPKAATFTGAVHDFALSGQFLVDALSEVAGLTPGSAVLDVGCGVGRFARAMAVYLDADGRYEGLDIVPAGIAWCTNNISNGYDNVHFTLADVRNGEYNPKGRQAAAEYTFPYPDGTFDLVVLISVFTHLLTAETDRYLSEIARVLKPGGRCFATFYLITPESIAGMATIDQSWGFKRPSAGPCWIVGARVPELGVAFEEDYITATCAQHGLAIQEPIYRGAWFGQPSRWPSGSGLGGQDTIIATKPAD